MIRLTERDKRSLTLGVAFILIFSAINWVILPASKEYTLVKEELEKAKRSYNQAVTLIRTEEESQQKYVAYSTAYQELKSLYYVTVDEKEGMLKFLALIEEMASQSGATIVSKNTTTGSKESGFVSLQVNLTLRGTADQLTNLLLAFRTAPIAINVDRLRIDLDQRNRLLQMRITVATLIIEEE